MAQQTETVQTIFLIFSGLLMLVLFLSKFLHDHARLNAFLSEPAMTLLVGMAFSFVVSMVFVRDNEETNDFNGNSQAYAQQGLAESILSFQSRVFFLALLPPILFNSGYQLQRELFYRHFTPIALFACVGTCVSGFCTGGLLVAIRELGLFGSFEPTVMELLTFGALIAATDTVSVVGILQAKKVDPHLFSLVFGESAINDAVALVLFKSLSTFLIEDAFGDSSTLLTASLQFLAHLLVQASCSPILGMLYAFAMGMAFKYVDMRQHQMLELALYIMPMYIPFILSEALELSGMITIFFTGLFAKRYMEPNVSASTKEHAGMLFKLFAFLAETCIFLDLGLSVFGLSGKFQWRFIGFALLTALLGRAASIYPLAGLYNLSLTRMVAVCAPCLTVPLVDEESIDAVGSSFPDGSSISAQWESSMGSWTVRRETPKRRLDKRISLKFMHILTFVGLRGAVAYACARDFPNLYGNTDEFVAATMVIVLFTVVIMGGLTEPLMAFLEIQTNVDETEYMRQWHAQRKLKGRFHRFEYYHIYRNVVRCFDPNFREDVSERFPTTTTTRDDFEHQMSKACMLPVIGNKTLSNHGYDYSQAHLASPHLSVTPTPAIDALYIAPELDGIQGTRSMDDSNVLNRYSPEDGRRIVQMDLPQPHCPVDEASMMDYGRMAESDDCSFRELRQLKRDSDDASSLGSTSCTNNKQDRPGIGNFHS